MTGETFFIPSSCTFSRKGFNVMIRVATKAVPSIGKNSLHCFSPCHQEKPDTPRFLITLDVGIGDAVAIGLSAVDQIIQHDPLATGTIDVLCNELQAQIFACDPRINRIITTSKVFFPGTHITQWLRGITLDAESAEVIHFLRQRRYEAIFPSIVAPGLYFRLHSHMMYPRLSDMMSNYCAFRRQADIHVSTIARQMVNHYFMHQGRNKGRKAPLAVPQPQDIPLYITSEHVQKAIKTVATLQKEASVEQGESKLLMIAPDTATEVTRPPLDLLVAALSTVLAAGPNLIVYTLPSYTDTTRSLSLQKILVKHYPHRVFLMPAEPKAHLLETAALIDQADIFVTGDTGVMHLAAAHKQLREGDNTSSAPRNAVKIVALFGGTNPAYFGYSRHTKIVGRGRKEQTALRPGFSKESYHLRGRNMFDHISPQQIVDAILSQ
jgi:ADP-heptose:LPS heptosyltransferase